MNRNRMKKRKLSHEKDHINEGESCTVTDLCPICYDHKSRNEVFEVQGCNHKYCKDCIRGHINAKVQENILNVRCPSENCEIGIEPLSCRDVIPLEVLERWENALSESLIPASQKFYCLFEDCSALLIMDEGEESVTSSECPFCHRLFCAQCRVPWHGELQCTEFQDLANSKDNNDDLLFKLAEEKNWRRCEKCRYFVERSVGCEHMKCRCGHEFCIICGREWQSGHQCATAPARHPTPAPASAPRIGHFSTVRREAPPAGLRQGQISVRRTGRLRGRLATISDYRRNPE